MSVSSLPEWKQLLLERKRREEEERERREKEEEDKLANMPAWKRGIIQRRKAKQENLGDREKDKDVCLLQVDVRSPSDGLSDTDSSITVNLGSDMSLSPDPGQWLDAEPKPASQVSMETIVPVHENPFIRTQSVWRKGRDAEIGNESDIKDKDKSGLRGQDVETNRGRDTELKIERFRDLTQGWDKEKARDRSLGRERENSRERWDKDKKQQKDAAREQEKEIQPLSGAFPPAVPCLRTIRADNIIIIEQESKGGDEQRGRWREVDGERPEEDQHGKRGMKMDLREILAGGGSVTEIRASEVLIIKPSVSTEERTTGEKGGEEGETRCSVESLGRELRADMSWLREKEKERPWGQATVIKDDGKDSSDDCVFVERGGRVSQLLSKFGEHPKPPSRSKSSDNFLQPGRRKYSGEEDDQQSDRMKSDGTNVSSKSVPKRSFSFSDRVISAVENGDKRCTQSDKSVAPWADAAVLAKLKQGCARLLDKERFGKYRDVKNEDHKGDVVQRNEAEAWKKHRSELRKVELVEKRATEKVAETDGDKGFTVASLKNTEGISFARRVPIRQDGRTRAEREARRLTREKSLENMEKDSDSGKAKAHVIDKPGVRRDDGLENNDVEALSPNEAQYRHDSAFTECSSLLCTVLDRVHQRGPEWSGTGPQGPYLTHCASAQQTETLISKVEKLGDTTVYTNERGETAYKASPEVTKENQQEAQTGSLTQEATTRSPKRITPFGMLQGPLEIQIPRTVFYVAEDMVERKKSECQSSDGQDRDGGQQVERRDSWRVGKPLSRIESLREKIRQRELEKQRQREAQGGAAETCDAQTGEVGYEERGSEQEREWEAAACEQTRPVDAERMQEEAAEQTSTTACDVKQEVGVLKTCPQLPVSVPHTLDESGGEALGKCCSAAAEDTSDSSQISGDEDDPLKYVEAKPGCHRGRYESTEEEEDDEEEEKEKELSEEKVPFDSISSLSSSPLNPNSLEAMSRIYNLDTVGSRSGLCLRERTVEVPPTLHLVKVKPLVSSCQQGDSKAPAGDNICGVQRQIEQFKLKEQEVLKSCSNASSKDRETKGQQSPKGVLKHHIKDDEETPELNLKESPRRNCSPTSQLKQTVTPPFQRTQSPENSLKPANCAPTPASSPSLSSPSNSPSASPSPTPSPKLFTIKSASGGMVKRGATVTITPRRPVAGRVTDSKPRPTAAESTKGSSQPTTPAVDEPVKKKYPAVEEIKVIGGYQHLEKSCLVKNRGTPKNGKVCFDEEQLEQVCEYPSETFMLMLSPLPPDLESNERQQGEEAQEDEGEGEEGEVVFKTMKSVGIATGPRIRVGQCHPLLRKHSV
ncbi:zinc finger CCCH domain-containing protein 13 isoform X1 [Nothobranchius furzeri]|uniref:Transcript variant X1 n=5 Tax=Nothobranchius TaxID=28779 RepID=A0A9D3BK39_NOTFU|nr:transcript variant X1 [Nothobranchius furzeri]